MRYDMQLILVGHILCIAFCNIGYTGRKKLQNRPLLRAEKYLEASRLGPWVRGSHVLQSLQQRYSYAAAMNEILSLTGYYNDSNIL